MATSTRPPGADAGSGPHASTPWVLPEGGRLIHIGPHKTGSTSLQAAMYAARPDLLAQGVYYPSRARHPLTAVLAGMGRGARTSEDPAPERRRWTRLLDEFDRAGQPRVVLSSEFLSDAPASAIPSVVEDLGVDRVWVVVTLRPLSRLLTSQWQQYVQSGLGASFDDWLESVFGISDRRMTKSFWYRHRHDELIDRWARVVGVDRMIAVVIDERDHGFLYRAFESMLDLRPDTLVPVEVSANRSMTVGEVETVRAFNNAFRSARLRRLLRLKVMSFGAARYMKRLPPVADDPKLRAPQWAIDQADAVATGMVERIRASGILVMGDLDRLATASTGSSDDAASPAMPDPVAVPPEVAARAVMGVLYATGLATEPGVTTAGLDDADDQGPATRPPEIPGVSSRQIAKVLVQRGSSAAVERATALRHRGR